MGRHLLEDGLGLYQARMFISVFFFLDLEPSKALSNLLTRPPFPDFLPQLQKALVLCSYLTGPWPPFLRSLESKAKISLSLSKKKKKKWIFQVVFPLSGWTFYILTILDKKISLNQWLTMVFFVWWLRVIDKSTLKLVWCLAPSYKALDSFDFLILLTLLFSYLLSCQCAKHLKFLFDFLLWLKLFLK